MCVDWLSKVKRVYLSIKTHLSWLFLLAYNKLTDVGIEKLAKGLEKNKFLKEIYLCITIILILVLIFNNLRVLNCLTTICNIYLTLNFKKYQYLSFLILFYFLEYNLI